MATAEWYARETERREKRKEITMRYCGNHASQITAYREQYYQEHKTEKEAYNRERREYLASHGLCTRCGQREPEPGRRLCPDCAAWQRGRTKMYYDRRRAEKLAKSMPEGQISIQEYYIGVYV